MAPPRRLRSILTGLLALALLMTGALSGLRAGWAASDEASAAATPDCGPLPDEPFPVLQRTRQLARLGVDHWHSRGQRGRGVKVAILDSGFRGYRAQLGRALPAHVSVRSFRVALA